MPTVPLLDVTGAVRWINETGAQELITSLIGTLESDFRRWESFERSPRAASHSPTGVIELMPTSDGLTYSFKYVNGHPSNPGHGLQTVTAFGVLADVSSGYPVFMAEMTLLTALRTAATSALAARFLAPPRSHVMAMIGTGSQAEFQALAFRTELGINSLRVHDTDPHTVAKFVRNATALGFDVHVAADAEEAVAGAQVITTCTADKTNATVLTSAMVESGVHVNAIGGDCPGKTELEAALLVRSKVFVEHTEQTRIEGEIQQMPADFACTELWEVVVGSDPGRTSAEQITVFDSVGFAIEDFSVLRHARAAVSGTAWVTHLDLIAEPVDPKDLYSLLTDTAAIRPPPPAFRTGARSG
ncbi:ornithine cyclodeaminase [Nocardioides gilvus]|uniref:ornithine cyclodeaminase n=1 Tax=Nocardioides gilvus TaxID=1735589 RepID=UPI000D7509D8|nr:ornithine cyclodeaminase [Nocardioides gilvus]